MYTVYMCVSSHRFEQRTTEAAKLKLDVDKASETIGAAENLIGKLEGEYKRWSTQVRMCVNIIGTYIPTIFDVVITTFVLGLSDSEICVCYRCCRYSDIYDLFDS